MYQNLNAPFLCFKHVDIKWYHLLLTPLEFERMVSHLVLLVFAQHSDEKLKVEMKRKSNCAPDGSVMLANDFPE